MIVLGFDTSTAATVVGLRLADTTTFQARDDPEGDERPGHATRLLPLAGRLLADAGIGWGGVGRIAVGVGPGTFTGLRIGVATARGLAQSLGVELVGVSSLRALACSAHAGMGDDATGVLAVIDARRGEVFAAAYHGDTELISPRALAPNGIGELLEAVEVQAAPTRWIAVGDGALRYPDALRLPGMLVPEEHSPLHRIDARAICELGNDAPSQPAAGAPEGATTEGMPTEKIGVVPDYRRRPDAEIALDGVA